MQQPNSKMGLFRMSMAIAASCMALTGCGDRPTADSNLDIYGGSAVEQGEWLSTVGLATNNRLFCSGTIVHPRLVITAAHCVSSIYNPSSLSIYVGNGSEGGNVRAQYRAQRVAYSPKYSQKSSGWDDIAYVVTEEPMDIPSDAIIPILVKSDEIDSIIKRGNYVRIVGFGGRNGGGYGVKYETDAPITGFNSNEVNIGANGKDSCQGDSGGPAYGKTESGEWRVFGIVSRGGACGYGGIWGRMSANICWVQEDAGINLNLPAGICGDSVPPSPEPTPEPTPEPSPDNPCGSDCTLLEGTLSNGEQAVVGETFEADGDIVGYLVGPAGTDFDLYLQKYSTFSGWQTVASSTEPASEEKVSYSGSGKFRWVVDAYDGEGGYKFYTL